MKKKIRNVLSPFEVKNTLIDLAGKTHHHSMINAGRGNPNWVATIPRYAFFKLGLFALSEAGLSFKGMSGFGGIAQPDGIVERFNTWAATDSKCAGIQLFKKCFSSFAIISMGLNQKIY